MINILKNELLVADKSSDGFAPQNLEEVSGCVGVIDVELHIVVLTEGEGS